MNIFVIDSSPSKAARQLCDQHINKMVLESAQMIANCFSLEILEDAPKTKSGTARKHSYFNHPCSIWVRDSTANLRWLLNHAIAMERERIARGYKPHFSIEFIKWAKNNISLSNNPVARRTEFAIAISENMTCRQVPKFDQLDRVSQYRLYYKYDKPFATWKRNKPTWI